MIDHRSYHRNDCRNYQQNYHRINHTVFSIMIYRRESEKKYSPTIIPVFDDPAESDLAQESDLAVSLEKKQRQVI